MVLRTVRFNPGSNGFLTFWYRTVLVVKRTVTLRGSRLIRSDRTIRLGLKNLIKLGGFDGYTSKFKEKGITKQKVHIANQ